jgi:hypothetical protein
MFIQEINLKKIFFALLFNLFFTLPLLSGCATHPALQDYPRRQIDRPYTLPNTLSAWEPTFGIESTRDNLAGTSPNLTWINPFPIRTSLNNNWNLLWNILPMGVQYQILHDDKNMLKSGPTLLFSGGINLAKIGRWSQR